MDNQTVFMIGMIGMAAILIFFYFYNRRNYKKYIESQDLIEKTKMQGQIFVIDKKFSRPTKNNLPTNIFKEIPTTAKLQKLGIIKAKVGSQIVTLVCDKDIYEILPTKKTIKVELAGLYVVSVVGADLSKKKKKTIAEKAKIFLKGEAKNESSKKNKK